MTRKRKLLMAGLILTFGVVLAWPFRLTQGESETPYSSNEVLDEPSRASNGDPVAATSVEPPGLTAARRQVPAREASTTELPHSALTTNLEPFDLANHPAIANSQSPPVVNFELETTEGQAAMTDSRPVYSTADPTRADSSHAWPAELIHVVTNGDTLEELAERYLNDSGRALEIFDLNRDQLSNPHLLPIGAGLRVPVEPNRIID